MHVAGVERVAGEWCLALAGDNENKPMAARAGSDEKTVQGHLRLGLAVTMQIDPGIDFNLASDQTLLGSPIDTAQLRRLDHFILPGQCGLTRRRSVCPPRGAGLEVCPRGIESLRIESLGEYILRGTCAEGSTESVTWRQSARS